MDFIIPINEHTPGKRYGSWKPWVLSSPKEFRPGPLPAFGSDAANGQYAAVKNLNRTNNTNHLAWFWQPGFFQTWLQQVDLEIFPGSSGPGCTCASGASAAVMSALFPNNAALFTSMANDAGTSTFDALIHTQLDVSDGLKLGTQVGQKIAARASADGAN